MAEVRTVKNTSNVAQQVVYKGTQFVLHAGDEQSYDKEVADKFIELCAPVVIDTTEKVGSVYRDPEITRNSIWIANMTGNPEAPEKVSVRQMNEKTHRIETIEIVNPNKKARALKRSMQRGHHQHFAKDGGMVQTSYMPKEIEIPEFRRREFDVETGQWFLRRDAASGEYANGCIESRPPAEFEPDMSWKLNDMRAYGALIDPSMQLGPDEQVVAREVAEKKLDAKAAAELLRKAKHDLLRRLYFRIVNPAYRLPNKKEFTEFVTGVSEDDVSKAELESVLAAADKQSRAGLKTLNANVTK